MIDIATVWFWPRTISNGRRWCCCCHSRIAGTSLAEQAIMWMRAFHEKIIDPIVFGRWFIHLAVVVKCIVYITSSIRMTRWKTLSFMPAHPIATRLIQRCCRCCCRFFDAFSDRGGSCSHRKWAIILQTALAIRMIVDFWKDQRVSFVCVFFAALWCVWPCKCIAIECECCIRCR